MQVCDHCGACREAEWRRCPFCHAELGNPDTPITPDSDGFDPLAAVSELTDDDVLPSPVPTVVDDGEELPNELLTEDDLAHLTGLAAPDNNWETPPPPAAIEVPASDDDGVSRAVIVPLIAAAAVAVVFVAYSIVTQSPAQRPQAVALIDRTTTTAPPSPVTSEANTSFGGGVPIGVDIAEQAERMCRGDQFSIARSNEPSAAIYNDVMVAVRDGRSDWDASPDQQMLRGPVPPLVGCLQTSDAGEIDRCPNTEVIISRRSVAWSYRVLRTLDGEEVGFASGTAAEVRPCEQLEIEADGSDYGSWSPLPTDQLDAVAGTLTTAPHPQLACSDLLIPRPAEPTPSTDERDPVDSTEPESPMDRGLAMHATAYTTPDVDHPLPKGWSATGERPVEAVLCLVPTIDLDRVEQDVDAGGRDAEASADGERLDDGESIAPEPPTGCPISVAAVMRSGEWIGSWEYPAGRCPADGDPLVPTSWLAEVVGPQLGYAVAGGSVPDSSAAGE